MQIVNAQPIPTEAETWGQGPAINNNNNTKKT